MYKEEYKKLKNSSGHCRVFVDDISNPSENRTLLYGYTLDRNTFHIYVMDGEIHKIIYNRISNFLIYYKVGKSFDVLELIPDKRVYPEYSEYEFCQLLIDRGCTIPFTTFSDTPSGVPLYGLTHNDFHNHLDFLV
jgi:hypothetical protein